MMASHVRIAALLLLPIFLQAQSLLEAISDYPALSNFKSLIQGTPNLAPLLTGASQGNFSQKYTILVPSNKAFDSYRAEYGNDISGLSMPELQAVLNYHILDRSLPSPELLNAPPPRLVIPTELTGETYNNRTAGSELETGNNDGKGQVVLIKIGRQSGLSRRQSNEISVVSGLQNVTKMTPLDGKWDHGLFQMVDNFLTLPRQCTATIRDSNLASLERALSRAELSDTLDHLANVTCIGPTDDAFAKAGNPDQSADSATLVKALTFHTLNQPVYTNFLVDGQELKTVSNQTVRVTRNSTGIWFNDAKLITVNVLTNNGVIQVVDKVMSPLPASSTTSNPSSTTRPSPSPSKTSSASSTLKPGLNASYVVWSLAITLTIIIRI